MEQKRCFFIGHRDTPETVKPVLQAAVEQHIVEYGVTEFLVGRYGAFDWMAAECVIAAKKQHPQVVLTLLLPYHPGERKVVLPEGFDGSLYPPGQENVPRRAAIVRANHYAVHVSDYIIVYAKYPGSNAWRMCECASECTQKKLLNLAK